MFGIAVAIVLLYGLLQVLRGADLLQVAVRCGLVLLVVWLVLAVLGIAPLHLTR